MKSEGILKHATNSNFKLFTANDLDNLLTNESFEKLNLQVTRKELNSKEELSVTKKLETSKSDYTFVEILDSKNSMKQNNFDLIRKKFSEIILKNSY
jgi:ribosomal protein L9